MTKNCCLFTATLVGALRQPRMPPRRPTRWWSPVVSTISSASTWRKRNELSSIQTVPSLYQRLVQPDRNNPEKSCRSAESWQADPAAKTLTIKPEADAKFASGNPLRPEDVIFYTAR